MAMYFLETEKVREIRNIIRNNIIHNIVFISVQKCCSCINSRLQLEKYILIRKENTISFKTLIFCNCL